MFGAQCVVLAIDAKADADDPRAAYDHGDTPANGHTRAATAWEAYLAGGRTPPAATWSSGRARRSSAAPGRSC